MHKITRTFLIAAAAVLGASMAQAQDFSPEQHSYNIRWKWGLMNLQAAQAQVCAQCSDGNFYGTMDGHSIAWGGRIYSVADTLQARLDPANESIEYVNGWYRKPKVGQTESPDNPVDYRTIMQQGLLSASSSTMEAVDITANMLSMFYFARAIDFSSMQPGQSVTIPISDTDGSAESVSIVYNGLRPSSLPGVGGNVYDITFNYSYCGRPSAYPVDCEISVDRLVPVFFSADIKIGHVEMALN